MDKESFSYKREIVFSLILSIVAMGINYLIQLILTPYVTNHLGTEAYGFVSLAKTISNYGIIVTSCLNSFSSRFITVEYHNNNYKNANIYYSSVVIANVALLIAVFVFDIFFTWKLEYIIKIPDNLVRDVKILFFLDIINYMVLAIGNTFTVYAYIKNKLTRIHSVRIVSYSIEAIILFVLFRFSLPKTYYVGIALIVSSIVLLLLNYLLSNKYLSEIEINLKYFSIGAVKELIGVGIWNAFNQMGNILNSGLDLLVSNLMLTAVAMGELSIVKTIATIISTLALLISNPFHPRLLKLYSEKKIDEVVSLFINQIKINGYIVCIVFSGFIAIGKNYFELWTPSENSDLLYGIAVVTVVGFIFEGLAMPLFYTYTLALKNRIPCIITIISGFLNVLGMYILLKYTGIGLYGVVGTTTVLGIITFGIFTPIYSAHCLGVKWNVYYPIMIKAVSCSLIMGIITKLIRFDKISTRWSSLILSAIVICIISAIMYYFFVLSKSDKKYIKNKIITLLNVKQNSDNNISEL